MDTLSKLTDNDKNKERDKNKGNDKFDWLKVPISMRGEGLVPIELTSDSFL